jgi:hypothetical protein
MAAISLKTASNVKPTILKGRNNNHSNGNMNSMSNARGQQITNRIHYRPRAIKIFISY